MEEEGEETEGEGREEAGTELTCCRENGKERAV